MARRKTLTTNGEGEYAETETTKPKPNTPSQTEFLKAVRELGDIDMEIDAAAAQVARLKRSLGTELKRLKSIGFNTKMLREAMKVRRQNADEVQTDYRDLGRYLQWMGSPVGTQFGLFDEAKTEVPSEHREWEARETGVFAGRAGNGSDTNPFPAGSALHQQWHQGWLKGQEAIAQEAWGGGKTEAKAGKKGAGAETGASA